MSKKSLTRNFIMMMSMLFLLVAAAVAWFVSISKGNMDNTEFESVDAIVSQINTSEGFYNGQSLNGLNVILTPVSGTGSPDASGNAQLYSPIIAPFTEAEPIDGTWKLASGFADALFDFAAQKAYVSYIDYYSIISANKPAKLALGSESKVVPTVPEYNGVDPEDPDRDVNSKYGEFSVDNIAGAVRVAFISCIPSDPNDVTGSLGFDTQGRLCNIVVYEEDGEIDEDYIPIDYAEQLLMIWVPNDRYELTQHYEDFNGSGNMVLTGADFTTNGQPEAAYYYHTASGKAQYTPDMYCTDSQIANSGFVVLSDSLWFNPHQNNYCACLKIRIWVEGYDRETSVALEGGMFDSEIYLLTIQEGA